jgi:ubiquinone/menaquinone biosynthesis C-methylase UbiE
MKCLDIGPGKKAVMKQPGESWKTLQHPRNGRYKKGDISHDITNIPWPIKSNTYQIVYASHVLEHVPWYQTIDVLQEIYRILVPGGCAEIYVPDLRVIVNCYLTQTMADTWRKHNPEDDYMLWVNGRLFTYGDKPHRAAFDEPYLKRCMIKAGFQGVSKLDKPRVDNHRGINLGVGGKK